MDLLSHARSGLILTLSLLGGTVGGVAMFFFGGWVTLAGVAWAWKWAYYDDEPTTEQPAEAIVALPSAGAPALPPATETIEDPDEDPDDRLLPLKT